MRPSLFIFFLSLLLVLPGLGLAKAAMPVKNRMGRIYKSERTENSDGVYLNSQIVIADTEGCRGIGGRLRSKEFDDGKPNFAYLAYDPCFVPALGTQVFGWDAQGQPVSATVRGYGMGYETDSISFIVDRGKMFSSHLQYTAAARDRFSFKPLELKKCPLSKEMSKWAESMGFAAEAQGFSSGDVHTCSCSEGFKAISVPEGSTNYKTYFIYDGFKGELSGDEIELFDSKEGRLILVNNCGGTQLFKISKQGMEKIAESEDGMCY